MKRVLLMLIMVLAIVSCTSERSVRIIEDTRDKYYAPFIKADDESSFAHIYYDRMSDAFFYSNTFASHSLYRSPYYRYRVEQHIEYIGDTPMDTTYHVYYSADNIQVVGDSIFVTSTTNINHIYTTAQMDSAVRAVNAWLRVCNREYKYTDVDTYNRIVRDTTILIK